MGAPGVRLVASSAFFLWLLLHAACAWRADSSDRSAARTGSAIVERSPVADAGAASEGASADVGTSRDDASRPDGTGDAGNASDADLDVDADHPPTMLVPMILVRRNDMEEFELTPLNEEGEFDEENMARARLAFARGEELKSRDIHPRLLQIIYSASRHFGVPKVLVTSGYRPYRRSSLHFWGRAADIQLEGVPCQKLAEHLRDYGFVGVGFYPRTNGVHIDIRRESYFWVSWAPQGKTWRERAIMHDLAEKMDEAALERGIEPPEPLPKEGQLARERRSLARWRATKGKARGKARPARGAKTKGAAVKKARPARGAKAKGAKVKARPARGAKTKGAKVKAPSAEGDST